MARSSKLVKPAHQELLHLQVLRSERLSPHWMRVTLGGGQIERFAFLGYDQWFRLFLPLRGDAGLERIPAKAHTIVGFFRYLSIPGDVRPVMRNYTVRDYRPASAVAGAEIDVDFVVHGTAEEGTAGPASSWALTCRPGDSVVILDEGLGFNPERGTDHVLLIADESGLPAVAGVCAALPDSATGTVLVEVPEEEDALAFAHPDGVEVRWLVRENPDLSPGSLALSALRDVTLPEEPFHAFVVGEQSLPTGARRHLVAERGVDKDAISFVGYWRAGAGSPAAKARASAHGRS